MAVIPIFPQVPRYTYSVHKRPTWATLEYVAVSGRRVSSPQQAYPLWEFELTFEGLFDQTQNQTIWRPNAGRHDFTLLSELFLAMAGKYGQFYLNDPSDNSRWAQPSGIGDGVTRIFTAMRTWGLGTVLLTEPVGGINTLDTVYLNGIEQDTNTYSFSGNQITFNNAPSANTAITLDFSYYYLCQFLEDQHDYDQFMTNLWTLKSCKMRSVKQ